MCKLNVFKNFCHVIVPINFKIKQDCSQDKNFITVL